MGQSNPKDGVILLGKIPPPYYGPAVATQILLNSQLNDHFNLIHVDTRLNTTMLTVGQGGIRKVFKTIGIYLKFISKLFNPNAKLVLVPIAQDTTALFKDSIFILLAKLFGKKVLLHLRGSSLLNWYSGRGKFLKWYFGTVMSGCDGAIVLGNNLRYIFETFLPPEKVHVVPNGRDIDAPQKASDLGVFNILCLSNLQPNKGIIEVIEAVKTLKLQSIDGFKLAIVGSWRDDNFETKCRDLVDQSNLPIEFMSSKSGKDKFDLFARSDIFVFTPIAPEGHPWVIVEALASGLPVISTDQGAIVESVIDGHNGFIVPAGSPEAIAGRIKELLADAALRSSMGARGRERYEKEFTESVMVQNLANAINATIRN